MHCFNHGHWLHCNILNRVGINLYIWPMLICYFPLINSQFFSNKFSLIESFTHSLGSVLFFIWKFNAEFQLLNVKLFLSSKLQFAHIAHVKTFEWYLSFHIKSPMNTLAHLPFWLREEKKKRAKAKSSCPQPFHLHSRLLTAPTSNCDDLRVVPNFLRTSCTQRTILVF